MAAGSRIAGVPKGAQVATARSRASLGESPSASPVCVLLSVVVGSKLRRSKRHRLRTPVRLDGSSGPSPGRGFVASPLVASPDEIHHDALHKTAMRLAPSELVMERIRYPLPT